MSENRCGIALGAPPIEPEAEARAVRKVFWMFVLAHVVVWTLAPLVCFPNASLDSVEMVYWGREWQLGYTKHPPLVGWVAACIMALTGAKIWGLYLAAQLAIAACFWSAWRLGIEVAGRKIALWGVLALEGSFFLTYEGAVFNNNVGLYPFWALAVLCFYWALQRQQIRYWLATGACIGLGLLCKYSMAVLPLIFAMFVILDPRSRPAIKRPGPYLALAAAAIIVSPHVWWAVERGFPTLAYAASRTRAPAPLLGRLWHPLSFTLSELLSLTLVFLIVLPLVGLRPRLRNLADRDRWNRNFLLAMTCGPFALLLLVSLLANAHFRGMHGSHLWPFVGLTLLCVFELRPAGADTRQVVRHAAYAGALVVAVFAVRSLLAPYVLGRSAREHFPGAQLAAEVEQTWRNRYGCPLTLVGGDSWLAGNVAFYSGDCPSVYEQDCTWLEQEEFLRRGGVVVWNASSVGAELPAVFKRLGPSELQSLVTIRHQTAADLPPVQIGVAFIAPPPAEPFDWLADKPPLRSPGHVAERLDAANIKLR